MPDDARPWIDAWHDALYGPSGFYRRDEGPAGHFVTSAQGIPGVSDILAQTVAALAERCGAEVVIDFACGRGELATSLLPFVAPDVEVIGVDVVERPTGLDERVTWVRSPGGAAVAALDALAGRRALVIAHEWLDVVPCVVAEVDDAGVLREVLTTREGEESLGSPVPPAAQLWADTFSPPSPPREASPPRRTPTTSANPVRVGEPGPDQRRARRAGERIEIGRTRDDAWNGLVDEVRRCAAVGSIVVGVDYGVTAETRSPLGTLTGFRDGGECPPRPDGSCDITAHVAVDSLDTDACTTQRDLVLDLFRPEHLAPVPVELATTNPPLYLQRLALRSAFAATVHPDGLGAFSWFTREIT